MAGYLIEGTGGIRKLRWGKGGRGKSGIRANLRFKKSNHVAIRRQFVT